MKKLLSIMLVLALALPLAACGSPAATSTGGAVASNPSSPSTPDASGSYVQGVTDTQVIIGNSAATSGAYAAVGVPFLAGIEAYLKMVNDQGGIDGREIVFNHITDDEFDPAKGKAALANLVEDEKAFAIVGHFGTPVVAATVDDLKEYGIPAVYFATGIGQLYAEKATTNAEGYNIFPVQPIYVTEGSIMVAYAAGKFEASKVGIIYTNDDAGMDLYRGATAQAEKIGLEVVAEQVTAGSADVSAAVTSIKNADVDFIIVASIQGTMPTIVKELAAQSVNKDCITTYVNVSSAMSEAVANEIQGKFDVYGLGWVDTESPDTKVTLELYQQWISEEYAMNAYAQTGWISAHFFCEGLRRLEGKEVTWESYMAALEEAPIQNPFGGIIDFAGGQRLGTQEMNLSKVVVASDAQVTGWELVSPLASIDSLLA
ncbi:ABC transporter substrate-binding protein [Ruminococcaceae bacterium OttesenSCG-928-A16]|nr:ABC transporter substrate-binding protein [Ruminococcaceae bacterium OttesenSCG-928-A16]